MKEKKKYKANFLREETSDLFRSFFTDVVFNSKLSFGCRIWILSTTTHKLGTTPKTSRQARKLKVRPAQIRIWSKQSLPLITKWSDKKTWHFDNFLYAFDIKERGILPPRD